MQCDFGTFAAATVCVKMISFQHKQAGKDTLIGCMQIFTLSHEMQSLLAMHAFFLSFLCCSSSRWQQYVGAAEGVARVEKVVRQFLQVQWHAVSHVPFQLPVVPQLSRDRFSHFIAKRC